MTNTALRESLRCSPANQLWCVRKALIGLIFEPSYELRLHIEDGCPCLVDSPGRGGWTKSSPVDMPVSVCSTAKGAEVFRYGSQEAFITDAQRLGSKGMSRG